MAKPDTSAETLGRSCAFIIMLSQEAEERGRKVLANALLDEKDTVWLCEAAVRFAESTIKHDREGK